MAMTREWTKDDSKTVEEVSDSFDRDLHGDDRAGQHAGVSDPRTNTAYDYKELHTTLPDSYTDDVLKKIPVLANGQRLQQGATYLDLMNRAQGPFVAQGDQEADTDEHLYVGKHLLDYELWNRLTGTEHP